MPVESATYISDLNASNPVGATDPKSQGDDHLRLIKSTVKASFSQVAGEVTASHVELNYMDGATGVTGTGNTVRSASPTFTGTVVLATVTATDASGLLLLNASNLASGTVPDARFPATLPALNGSLLTNLNASNLASGTVADGRLSSNVPLKNAAQTFTALNKFAAGSAEAARFIHDSSFVSFYNTADSVRSAYLSFTTVNAEINVNLNVPFIVSTNNTERFRLAGDGTLSTPNTSASEIGFKGIPRNDKTANYTLALTDCGQLLRLTTNSGFTITIPTNATVAFPIGTVITIIGHLGSATWTLAPAGGVTLYWAGTNFTTGNRTLTNAAMVTLVKTETNEWMVSGAGLS